MADLATIHKIFLNFDKRAEKNASEVLAATFVDSEPLFDLLATRNNQVIYGRRGTGKTHALKFLAEQVSKSGDTAAYIDLRMIGSNGSIYGDASRSLVERAGTLIQDVLSALLANLYEVAVGVIDKARDAGQITLRLDEFSKTTSEVRIVGEIISEAGVTDTGKLSGVGGFKAELLPIPKLAVEAKVDGGKEKVQSDRTTRKGSERLHLDFGRVGTALSSLIDSLGGPRIWLLIDEWSEVPLDLQPYLSDLIRRTILPHSNITVKIAAIEHRSQFSLFKSKGEYIGIELGADLSADLNLDDFLVFENNTQKPVEFFKKLLFKHYAASASDDSISTADQLIAEIFTQSTAFEEFVRAIEGVPRDALNLATKMVTRAWGRKIGVQDVRYAARDWYNQDKANVIKDNPELNDLLTKVIDEVIGHRKAKGFLFPANVRNEKIDALFDARILHILKKNTSSHDQPGIRYDVYKIDYGCYVELINTNKNPLGLFEEDENTYSDVPKDDYRSIRRAILRVEDISAPLPT